MLSLLHIHLLNLIISEQVIEKYGGINEEACERKLTLKSKPVFPLDDLGIESFLTVNFKILPC